MGVVVASFIAVLGQVAFAGARVESRDDLADVSWGFPARWISQDQASLDPPFPWVVGVSSPWERPTSIDWTGLALDVAAVALVLAVFVWLVVRGAGALRRRLLAT